MNEPQREMTLEEWVTSLPGNHRARKELAALKQELATLSINYDLSTKETVSLKQEVERLRAELWQCSLDEAGKIMRKDLAELTHLRQENERLEQRIKAYGSRLCELDDLLEKRNAALKRIEERFSEHSEISQIAREAREAE